MKLFKAFMPILLLTVLTTSCSSAKIANTSFWVNSTKADCDAGAGKTQCLQIYEGQELDNAQWSYFYSSIEGFTFEPGYFQKIEVSKTHLDSKNVPADASSIKYKLVKVLEKKQDSRMAIHDIWAATHINGTPIKTSDTTPTLEINITKMMVFGTDGCNNYTGSIKNLNDKTITFGPLAGTRKMCMNMETPDTYNKAIINSVGYKREGLNLYFYDTNGNEILRFKKVD